MPRPRTGTAYEKNGKWYIGVRLRDGRKWATPCPPRDDGIVLDHIHARSVAANLQRDYDAGRWDPDAVTNEPELASGVSAVTPTSPPTVVEFAREWIKTQRYGSVEKDKKRLEFYLAPSPLASHVLTEVRPRHVLAFIGWLTDRPSARGGTLAPRTVRNAYDVLRRALSAAVIADLIPSSPCAPLSNALPSMNDKHPGARETWLFTREEVERLISAPELLPDRRVTYAILFLTGCRWGELAALRFRDWNPGAVPLGRLIISRAIEPMTKREKGTKTGAVKRVPVHPALAEILTAWQARGFEALLGRAPTSEDFVLPTRRFTARGVDSGNRYLHEDCARLGLVPRHIHCARRTFISLAQDDGGEPGKLKWITHAPPKAVFDQYTTLQWKTLCAEVVKLQITLARSADAIVLPSGGGGSLGSDRLATGLATEAGTESAEGLVSSGLVTEAQRNRTPGASHELSRNGSFSGGFEKTPGQDPDEIGRLATGLATGGSRSAGGETVTLDRLELHGKLLALEEAISSGERARARELMAGLLRLTNTSPSWRHGNLTGEVRR